MTREEVVYEYEYMVGPCGRHL